MVSEGLIDCVRGSRPTRPGTRWATPLSASHFSHLSYSAAKPPDCNPYFSRDCILTALAASRLDRWRTNPGGGR
jgi:hypothetical protein